jgi:hypothetical protein
MAIGDVYRLTVECNHLGNGEEYINVHHFRQASGIVQAEEGADLCEAWVQLVQPLFIPLLSNSIGAVSLEVRKVGDPSYIFGQTVTGGTGTSTGDMLPPFVAPLISWRTGLAGRSRRGRTYMPPTAESHQAGGVIAASYLGAWADWADQMIQLAAGATHGEWDLVVRSETLNNSFNVTGYLLRTRVARQSRRQLGVGS